jgi:hypothetical protein
MISSSISSFSPFSFSAATIEEAKYYIEAKFKARNFANNIETELLRRRINYGEEK